VLGAETRDISGSGFSCSALLLCFIQSSGLFTASSNVPARQTERFLASISYVLPLRESANPVLFFCNTMPVSAITDQRKMIFT